ncbi:MAG: Zn-dependent hydrolase [Candidatus Dormiibacterota bacterium]
MDATRAPAIDGAAFAEDLRRLNELGRRDGAGGIFRVAFSSADLAGRAYVEERMRDLGLAVRRDEAGNTIGRLAGDDDRLPALAIGSHTDTVPDGGRYDGSLGVVGALAVIRALHAAGGRLRHPIEVLNFVAEEATMGGGTFGSRAMTGQLEPASLTALAYDDRPVEAHLREAGLEAGRVAGARRDPGELAAYLELHIEQGAVLWSAGERLGVVEGIVGIRRYRVEFTGRANHAGTTPMAGREDALVAAAPFVTALRDLAIAAGVVGTAGTLRVEPGAANVIPGRVELGCELRSVDEALLETAESALRQLVANLGGRLHAVSRKEPVRSDPVVMAALDTVVDGFGVPWRRLASGAGHDAMSIANLAPQGMLFVPSRDGVSHAPDEHTTLEDCLLGVRALLAATLELDQRLPR